MNFASIYFVLFVAATVLMYFLCPGKCRWYVLLISSCFFYIVAAGKRAFAVAILTVGITYIAAVWIERSKEDKKRRKLFLSAAVIVLTGILAVTKLKKFFMQDISWVIVPLGISYYTFSMIGYLVDVFSRKQAAERNPFKLTLYTLYFPKIMQGPISKFKDLGPRLIESHSLTYQNFCFGLQRILWGYFKKLVIVERATLLTGSIFDGNISDYSGGGAVLLIATFIATIRMYCDFSGYMDIVIGISQIMGIELDENFRQPLFSKSAAEFWRRWHITLGAWFKDYIYMALVINPTVIRIGKWVRDHVGKRAGKAVLTVIPLAVVWFLTGLWHGTGVDYILWGCYWGTLIIVSNVFSPEIKKLARFLHIKTDAPDWKLFQMVRTFGIFTGGLLISTYVGVRQLRQYAWYLLKDFGIGRLSFEALASYGLNWTNFVILAAAVMILWIVEVQQLKGSVRAKIADMNGICRWVLYAALFLSVVYFGLYGPGYSTSTFGYVHF